MNNEDARRLLVAEDDEDDFALLKDAFAETDPSANVEWVKDGEELLHYLDNEKHPDLVLLDLNMPRKDGREALKEIKSRSDLGHIPVVVLTTSNAVEDVVNAYSLGTNTYVRKPLGFSALKKFTSTFGDYWFRLAQLPTSSTA
jgi:CheY-like chemotaxis protein